MPFKFITISILVLIATVGCESPFLMRVVSGPGGISGDKYLFIGIIDFEGEGGKEIAKALALALQTKNSDRRKKHFNISYIPTTKEIGETKIEPKVFKRFDEKKRYKDRKYKEFERSRRDFERRAEKRARKLLSGSRSVQAILTGKMIFNDVMDLFLEKATEIHIMREASVKFYIVLIDGYTGRINGRAYDVWNKGCIFADTHIPKESFSHFELLIEDFVEGELFKVQNLSTTTRALKAVYDLLKVEFELPEVMIEKARGNAVSAAKAGILMGTNY
jgi:hypothetical protein